MLDYTKMEDKRKEKGLTVTKLCLDANVSRTEYNRILKKERTPNIEIVVRLCKVLDLDINTMIN